MKALIIAAALALTSCASLPAPNTVADTVVLDEQAAVGVELAYKTARTLAELAVDAGLVKPGTPLAAKVAAADNRAYAAVQGARAAYRAGNGLDYTLAVADALAAVDAFRTSVKG